MLGLKFASDLSKQSQIVQASNLGMTVPSAVTLAQPLSQSFRRSLELKTSQITTGP